MGLVITPEVWLLINLLIQNAITAAFNRVSTMTPEEVKAAIVLEEVRNKQLMDELNLH